MDKRSNKRTKLQKGTTAQGTEFFYYRRPVSVLSPHVAPKTSPKKTPKTKPVRIRKSTNKLG